MAVVVGGGTALEVVVGGATDLEVDEGLAEVVGIREEVGGAGLCVQEGYCGYAGDERDYRGG